MMWGSANRLARYALCFSSGPFSLHPTFTLSEFCHRWYASKCSGFDASIWVNLSNWPTAQMYRAYKTEPGTGLGGRLGWVVNTCSPRVNDSKKGNGHRGDRDGCATGDRNQCLANEAPAPCQKEARIKRSSEGPCASGGANARPVET